MHFLKEQKERIEEMIGTNFNTAAAIFALAVLASCCQGQEEDYVPLKEVVASLDSGYT